MKIHLHGGMPLTCAALAAALTAAVHADTHRTSYSFDGSAYTNDADQSSSATPPAPAIPTTESERGNLVHADSLPYDSQPVFGAREHVSGSDATADASHNTVELSLSNFAESITGAELVFAPGGATASLHGTACGNLARLDMVEAGDAHAARVGVSGAGAGSVITVEATGNGLTLPQVSSVESAIGGSCSLSAIGDNSTLGAAADGNRLSLIYGSLAMQRAIGGSVTASDIGTRARLTLSAQGNELSLDFGYAGDSAFGGLATAVRIGGDSSITVTASGNTVSLCKGASVNGSVAGAAVSFADLGTGCTPGGSVSGNSVRISGEGTHAGTAYGALSVSGAIGGTTDGQANALPVENNIVDICDGADVIAAYGGYSDAQASGNSVNIRSTRSVGVARGAFGGMAARGNSISLGESASVPIVIGGESLGDACDNNVTIGGQSEATIVSGGQAKGVASGNRVTVEDGSTVRTSLYGGYSENGQACGNLVTLHNARMYGDIYGGFSQNGTATGNTVTLKGRSNDLSLAHIYGGSSGAGLDARTGNTLHLDGFQGSVASVGNFSGIVITLRDWNPNDYVLVSEQAVDLGGVTVTLDMVSIAADAPIPTEGYTFKLFNNATCTAGTKLLIGNTVQVRYGATLLCDFEVTVAQDGDVPLTFQIAVPPDEEPTPEGPGTSPATPPDDSSSTPPAESQPSAPGDNTGGSGDVEEVPPDMTVTDVRLNPQLKSLSEGRLASLALALRAGDLVADKGAEQAARAAAMSGAKTAAFMSMASDHGRVETGSHIDVDGVAIMAGASASLLDEKELTLAGFMETGWGQYSTHNEFADMPAVSGSGESSYSGTGVLIRYASASCGLVLDASFRTGHQVTDFASYDIQGAYADYDVSSTYVGAHLGAAYTFKPHEKLGITPYARYLRAHLGSNHADIEGGRVEFDAVSSNRLRTGLRGVWQCSPDVVIHAGFAYERECSGTARASVGGERVDAPSMRGSTLIGEIGAVWRPDETKPLWVEASLQSSTGKATGYGAHVGCTLGF